MTELRGFALPEQHLALDALVALVDGELSASAHDRAVSHLARCPACSGRATAQRQARTAVRTAAPPMMPVGLLEALCAIPQHADLPSGPDELAVTPDGKVVTVRSTGSPPAGRTPGDSAVLGSGPALGSGPRLGEGSAVLGSAPRPSAERAAGSRLGSERLRAVDRRARNSASVVVSGLVLGAVALVLPAEQPERVTGSSTFGAEESAGGASAGGARRPVYDMGALPETVLPVVTPATAQQPAAPEVGPQSVTTSPGSPAERPSSPQPGPRAALGTGLLPFLGGPPNLGG
ncbi:anti-sigma factor family protein [Actinoalloteichus fjordicus]|uniref:Zinc-finger n=1 Tax=Actinoalloteichus fjordicus TaxID=1612552 RepID=A0AAC9PQM2_9PSEU|nr:zf-HC2 domain-containing protein [Actinoalloteichus fjordicus]APU12996.1 Putative zinc-finger [Actinoalloteichus fjordicus]